MDQSSGKPLPEHMSRELTSSGFAPLSVTRGPCARDRGPGKEGEGAANSQAAYTWSYTLIVCWVADGGAQTFGCDLNIKFSFTNIAKSLK
jgi:hypothetical protein